MELEDECEKLQEEFVDLSVRIQADGGALVNDNEEIIVVDAWEPSGVDGGKRDFIRKQVIPEWRRMARKHTRSWLLRDYWLHSNVSKIVVYGARGQCNKRVAVHLTVNCFVVVVAAVVVVNFSGSHFH